MKKILIPTALLLIGNEIISLAVLSVFGFIGISKLLQVMYEGGFY